MIPSTTLDAKFIDLSSRIRDTVTVVASPADATETVIASLAVPAFGSLVIARAVTLHGWAAYTVGTAGVSVQLRIRQTSVSGTVKADSGATTATAANLATCSVQGLDSVPPSGGQWVLTMTVASANAASTVSAVHLLAICV